MALVAIVVLLIIEALLLTGYLTRRSRSRWFVPLVRMAVLGVFGTLILTGAIDWSARWYLLVVWLAIIAAASELRATRNPGPPRTLRAMFASATVMVMIIIAASPALIFPAYETLQPTGPFQVTSRTYSTTDPSRPDPFSRDDQPRSLTYEIWYPDVMTGSFPLVVVSHGSMGIRGSNQSMFKELASHGYIVASIDHTGHALYTHTAGRRLVLVDWNFVSELRAENAKGNPQQSLT